MAKKLEIKRKEPKKVASFRLSEESKQMMEEIIGAYKSEGETIYQVDIVEMGIRKVYNATKRK